MKRHSGGIERVNSGDADEDGIDFEIVPILCPGGNVEFERIAFVEIQLPHAFDVLMPGSRRRILGLRAPKACS